MANSKPDASLTRLPILVLGVCVTALAACDSPEPPADIAIPVGTPLEIDETPLVSVGVMQGDSLQEFGSIVTPFLLRDGRLVVPDGMARTIRVFDTDGEHQASLGRPGEGPGEFSNILRVWPRGDTIEAYDFQAGRITQFLPDGSVQIVMPRSDRFGFFPIPGALADGWILSGVENAGPDREARARDRIGLVKVGLDGMPEGRLAETLGSARYDQGIEPLSPTGRYVVEHGRLYVAETLTPTINVYHSDGSLEGQISWEYSNQLDPASILSVVSDSAIARASPEDGPAVRRRLASAPRPDVVSVFWDFLVDGEEFVWVRPYDPLMHAHELGGWRGPGPGGQWLVFSPEGRELGTVQVPHDIVPMHVGTDAILGVSRDELGVQRVQVHRIRRH